jgi:hypothetical protein
MTGSTKSPDISHASKTAESVLPFSLLWLTETMNTDITSKKIKNLTLKNGVYLNSERIVG